MSQAYGQLVVQSQGNEVRRITLTAGTLTVGRTAENGLVLPSPLVSAKHAEIQVSETVVLITDLDSHQGTFVAGRKILPHQPTPISDGTIIQIGLFFVTYAVHRPPPEPPPPVDPVKKPPRKPQQSTPSDPVAATVPLMPLGPLVAPPAGPPRTAYPVNSDPVQQSAYLEFLPAIFHNQEFLGRFLFGFENLWELMEWRQDHIEMYFDPRTAPAAFLDWLVQWLDIAMDRHWPEPRKRDFITRAVELYRWRGTSSGLREMIHTCTGHYPEIDEINAFTFRILFDKDAAEHRDFIEDLIQMHKPAHAGYVLEFA